MISKKDFKNPPKKYRVVQYASVNYSDEEYDSFESYGIGGIVASACSKNHLKDEKVWDDFIKGSKRAKERGFQVWTYDEQGYPCGMAGGRIVEDNPEYECMGLYCLSEYISANEEFSFVLPEKSERFIFATAYPIINNIVLYDKGIEVTFDNKNANFKADENEYRFCVFGIERLRDTTQAATTIKQFGHSGLYPSLLSYNAVSKFIELTHQAYAHKIMNLNNNFDAFYSGEPNLMNLHFTGERENYQAYVPFDFCVFDRFFQLHRYDIMPQLGALFADTPTEYPRVRLHYYITIGDILSKSFSEQISNWCKKNNIIMAGHLLLEENIAWQVPVYGDFWKVMRHFHIPGADMPIMQSTGYRGPNLLGMRYVSSIARLQNKETQCLMDPIIGGHRARGVMAEFELMMDTVNFICYSGATIISTFGNIKSFEKDNYLLYNNYVGRICSLLRGAKDTSEVAIYYPVSSFQSRFLPDSDFFWKCKFLNESKDLQNSQVEIVEAMKRNAIDCNFLDEQAIEEANIINDRLCIAGYSYKVIIIPSINVISEKTCKKLLKFIENGGVVLNYGNNPVIGIYEHEDETVQRFLAGLKYVSIDEMIRCIKANIKDKIVTDADPKKMFISSYLKDEKKMFFIADYVGEEHLINVQIPNILNVQIFDAETGEIIENTLPSTIRIKKYRGVIIHERK